MTIQMRNTSRNQDSDTPADRGFLAWSLPALAIPSTSTVLPTAGLLNLVRVRRVPPGTITNIIVYVNTAGGTLTSGQCFASLFDSAGNHVRSSADQSTAWGTQGLKTMALSSPYANAAADYYVGFWFNGTTGPALARGGQLAAALTNAGLSAPNFAFATADSGLTTTAPSAFGAQTSLLTPYWVALS